MTYVDCRLSQSMMKYCSCTRCYDNITVRDNVQVNYIDCRYKDKINVANSNSDSGWMYKISANLVVQLLIVIVG